MANNNNNIQDLARQIEEDNKQKQQVIEELTKGVNEFMDANNSQKVESCPTDIQTVAQIQQQLTSLFDKLIQESDNLKATYKIKYSDNFDALMDQIMIKINVLGRMLNKRGGKRRRTRRNNKRNKRKSRKN
jgi:ABC-type transporter Mla subunit MlaD